MSREEKLAHLRDLVERYLKREGLYQTVVEHRRYQLFTLPTALLWLGHLWAAEVGIMLANGVASLLLPALILPAVAFLLSFLGLVLFYLVRQLRLGKRLSESDASTIGGFFLFGFPVVTGVLMWLYLGSIVAFLTYLGLAVVGFFGLLFLQSRAYQIHRLWGSIGSIAKAVPRSLLLLPAIFSLLLVFTFLSVFSEEFWQAIGTLSVQSLVAASIVVLIPVALFAALSVPSESAKLVDTSWNASQLMFVAQETPFFAQRLASGHIAEEEWQTASEEVAWLHLDRLLREIRTPVFHLTKRWFALLIVFTGLFVLVCLCLYFFVFFSIVVPPAIIQDWTSPAQVLGSYEVLPQLGWRLTVPMSTVTTLKTSIFLATFLMAVFHVWAFTNEHVKGRLTDWLKRKAESWLAVSAVYRAIARPGYQVWDYVVQDVKGKSRTTAHIVVPQASSDNEVERACRHMESTLRQYRVVYITAFEQKPEGPRYRLGIPGRRWRLMRIGPDQPPAFEPIHLEVDESRYQHELAKVYLAEGESPPDEWFGETPRGIYIARRIWDLDDGHELVMHPYVFDAGGYIAVEINLYRRMEQREQYRTYLRRLLTIALESTPPPSAIDIELYFRDTVDSLAGVCWSKELPDVKYRDETDTKTTMELKGKWVDRRWKDPNKENSPVHQCVVPVDRGHESAD